MDRVDLTIREYRPGDLPAVLVLHRRALEGVGAYIPGSWNDDLNDIAGNYFDAGGTFLVGIAEDTIVAMGALRRVDGHTAEIKRMRTAPEHQGKGYGTRVLTELVERARALGYHELVLDTTDKQPVAMRLYQKMGFTAYKQGMHLGFNCTWFRMTL